MALTYTHHKPSLLARSPTIAENSPPQLPRLRHHQFPPPQPFSRCSCRRSSRSPPPPTPRRHQIVDASAPQPRPQLHRLPRCSRAAVRQLRGENHHRWTSLLAQDVEAPPRGRGHVEYEENYWAGAKRQRKAFTDEQLARQQAGLSTFLPTTSVRWKRRVNEGKHRHQQRPLQLGVVWCVLSVLV
jgi:hypothetical protein